MSRRTARLGVTTRVSGIAAAAEATDVGAAIGVTTAGGERGASKTGAFVKGVSGSIGVLCLRAGLGWEPGVGCFPVPVPGAERRTPFRHNALDRRVVGDVQAINAPLQLREAGEALSAPEGREARDRQAQRYEARPDQAPDGGHGCLLVRCKLVQEAN